MTEKPTSSDPNVDAAWTLVRWIVIPIILVAALYFVQRAFDTKPLVVVTDRGTMAGPSEIATAPSTMPPAPATMPLAPLVPTAPPGAPPPAAPPQIAIHPTFQPAPPYPLRALDAEKEGVVRLRLWIAPDGSVSGSQVLSAEPRGWFERAAQEGVKRWRYEPSESGGTADVEVEFKLK